MQKQPALGKVVREGLCREGGGTSAKNERCKGARRGRAGGSVSSWQREQQVLRTEGKRMRAVVVQEEFREVGRSCAMWTL